ncbi:cytochrome b [Phaeovulum vinaykumarii]|uniref:Cytochrome b561 n=1 Tax=Phaeovulum vinaykumarii TaxID=407234 RepID=A0A1N7L5I5_9RHOB|nr:cytochrome b/b6 domain-containing protein [Phaeovulum vinaykumarii]SIS69112.1 cytochrome b561 [Phaeovulum vinaykumarii]SOB99661.1 cytochrome b561 [Phaeovulum vinaykumarii]
MKTSTGYSGRQIALHWIAFVLIAVQYVLAGGIGHAYHTIQEGGQPDFDATVLAHVLIGGLILIFAVWRIVLRFTHGAPPPPESENPRAALVAKVTQGLLYVFMIAVPISGSLAWFGGLDAAGAMHQVGKLVLMLLIVLHIAGAIYNQVVLKNHLILRMMKAE